MKADDLLTDAQQRAARKALNDWIANEVESQARLLAAEEVRKFLDSKAVRDEARTLIAEAVQQAMPRLVKSATRGLSLEMYQ